MCDFLKTDASKTIKTLLVKGTESDAVALVLRGDHVLNEIKAEKHPLVAAPLEWLSDAEIKSLVDCSAGSIGVVGLNIPVIADRSAANLSDFVCGSNIDDVHYTGVNWVRDCAEPEVFDLRQVVAGDICARSEGETADDSTLSITRGIEVGHIFQLGTKYSEAMNASCLDDQGKAVMMPMGCYGIGVSRIVAAAIEQNHDDRGIIWPEKMAPFQVVITPIGYHKSDSVKSECDKIYSQLIDANIEVLLDDRKERPGIMFADADLIGIPHRLVIGEKSLANNEAEYKYRGAENGENINISSAFETIKARIEANN